MSLSTDPGRDASSTSSRCCRLLADAGFSHIPASKRDMLILDTCKPKDILNDALYIMQSPTVLFVCIYCLSVCIGGDFLTRYVNIQEVRSHTKLYHSSNKDARRLSKHKARQDLLTTSMAIGLGLHVLPGWRPSGGAWLW